MNSIARAAFSKSLLCGFVVVLLWHPWQLHADIFVLHSGGEVRGEWINRQEKYAKHYAVQTGLGVKLLLPVTNVKERVREKTDLQQYENLAPTYAMTVDAQWQLAQWCLEHDLPSERQIHLRHILTLDENHGPARRALGYQQYKGKWQTKEEYHLQHGYTKINGEWILPQDLELHKQKSSEHEQAREWLTKVKRWRADMSSAKSAPAIAALQEIRDPLAVPAILWLLYSERDLKVRILLYDVLVNIGNPAATVALLEIALSETRRDAYLECVDRVLKIPAIATQKMLVETLKHADNQRVNRAAYILGKQGNVSVIAPLIEALITRHRVATGDNPERTTTSFSGDGGIGFGKGAPAVVELPVENLQVLESLVELTKQNFRYDQRTWRLWYDIEKRRLQEGNVPAVRLP
jgi:hypothetical protein